MWSHYVYPSLVKISTFFLKQKACHVSPFQIVRDGVFVGA